VLWAAPTETQDLIYMTRSFDGGVHFEPQRVVTSQVACGALDPATGWATIDGIGGSRTNSFPSVAIANGAPSGRGATDEIVLAFCDASQGLNHERALVYRSFDGGESWARPIDATAPGDRPALAAVAIGPDGEDLYVTYHAFLSPWQTDTSSARPFQGVVRHARGRRDRHWSDLHRGAVGDARATSRPSLEREFIYDYISIAATDRGAFAVWLDARNAADCPAIDAYRQSRLGPTPLPAPDPTTDCPATFGNLDVYGGFYARAPHSGAPLK